MGLGFRMLLLLAALSSAAAPVTAERRSQTGDCPPGAGAETSTGKEGQMAEPCDEDGSGGKIAGEGADGKRQMERNVYFPLMRFEVPSWLRWWETD